MTRGSKSGDRGGPKNPGAKGTGFKRSGKGPGLATGGAGGRGPAGKGFGGKSFGGARAGSASSGRGPRRAGGAFADVGAPTGRTAASQRVEQNFGRDMGHEDPWAATTGGSDVSVERRSPAASGQGGAPKRSAKQHFGKDRFGKANAGKVQRDKPVRERFSREDAVSGAAPKARSGKASSARPSDDRGGWAHVSEPAADGWGLEASEDWDILDSDFADEGEGEVPAVADVPSKRRPAKAAEAAAPEGGRAKPARSERSKGPATKEAPGKGAGDRKPPKVATRAQVRAQTSETLATGVQTLVVSADEADMRLDRFLTARFPQLAFTHIQRIVRKGELRVDGGRVKPNQRLLEGQSVRVPPLQLAEQRPTGRTPAQDEGDAAFLRGLILYEDRDVMVLNKPMGLAVQGGSGTLRHVDGMLEAMRDADGQKPRLVHRLDKDTAGCLVIAKTRLAAATLAKSFRSRSARKVYWALVAGVPRVKQGRISTYIAKEEDPDGDSRMEVSRHGGEGASHAVTYYAVVDNSAQKLAWISLKPVTGRTHQLRVHTAHMGHPIVGDPKYFDIENWELPGGIQKKLHLLARRIVIPHPRTGKPIDVTAPLPPHMAQSWNLLGFETGHYDPIVESPEE